MENKLEITFSIGGRVVRGPNLPLFKKRNKNSTSSSISLSAIFALTCVIDNYIIILFLFCFKNSIIK